MMLLFLLGILIPLSFSTSDTLLTRHRRALPVGNTLSSSSHPQKWILHLRSNCSHNYFATDLHHRHHQLAIPSPKVTHEYHHVFHGVTVQDVEESTLQRLPCIKFYEKDRVKRLVSIPSWGIDRIDQEKLPLDNSYHSEYSGTNVDGMTSTSPLPTLPLLWLSPWLSSGCPLTLSSLYFGYRIRHQSHRVLCLRELSHSSR